jgi:HPt (histidine-containing phosphotransfer) domain-containing protein
MFLSEGFDGFVSKPVEIEELERVLKHVLPKSAITYTDGFVKEIPAAISEPEEEPEEKKDEVKSDRDIFIKLKDSGIDTDAGLRYCVGDSEFYRSLLIQFANESGDKIPQMKKFFAEHDWHNYEVLVHALKSTCKMIGILGLSDKAKELETAAREQKEDYIVDHHEDVIKNYSRIAADIKEQFNLNSDEDEILEFEPEDEAGNGGDEA